MAWSLPFFYAAGGAALAHRAMHGKAAPGAGVPTNQFELFSGAEDGVPPAREPALHPVAPNPFGSSTEKRISSKQSSDATVAVFDVEGRRVWSRHVSVGRFTPKRHAILAR